MPIILLESYQFKPFEVGDLDPDFLEELFTQRKAKHKAEEAKRKVAERKAKKRGLAGRRGRY